MVIKRAGQSTLEFVIIMGVLTAFGIFIAWKMWPTQTGGGALVGVLDNSEKKIGND